MLSLFSCYPQRFNGSIVFADYPTNKALRPVLRAFILPQIVNNYLFNSKNLPLAYAFTVPNE